MIVQQAVAAKAQGQQPSQAIHSRQRAQEINNLLDSLSKITNQIESFISKLRNCYDHHSITSSQLDQFQKISDDLGNNMTKEQKKAWKAEISKQVETENRMLGISEETATKYWLVVVMNWVYSENNKHLQT